MCEMERKSKPNLGRGTCFFAFLHFSQTIGPKYYFGNLSFYFGNWQGLIKFAHGRTDFNPRLWFSIHAAYRQTC